MKRLLLLCCLVFAIGCDEPIEEIDEMTTQIISYENLPEPVREILSAHETAEIGTKRQDFYCTDSSIVFQYGKSYRVGEGWINEVSSNYHHFFVNGAHYRFSGNKGEPFILHESFLYYCELNKFGKYEAMKFYKVRLKPLNWN